MYVCRHIVNSLYWGKKLQRHQLPASILGLIWLNRRWHISPAKTKLSLTQPTRAPKWGTNGEHSWDIPERNSGSSSTFEFRLTKVNGEETNLRFGKNPNLYRYFTLTEVGCNSVSLYGLSTVTSFQSTIQVERGQKESDTSNRGVSHKIPDQYSSNLSWSPKQEKPEKLSQARRIYSNRTIKRHVVMWTGSQKRKTC